MFNRGTFNSSKYNSLISQAVITSVEQNVGGGRRRRRREILKHVSLILEITGNKLFSIDKDYMMIGIKVTPSKYEKTILGDKLFQRFISFHSLGNLLIKKDIDYGLLGITCFNSKLQKLLIADVLSANFFEKEISGNILIKGKEQKELIGNILEFNNREQKIHGNVLVSNETSRFIVGKRTTIDILELLDMI